MRPAVARLATTALTLDRRGRVWLRIKVGRETWWTEVPPPILRAMASSLGRAVSLLAHFHDVEAPAPKRRKRRRPKPRGELVEVPALAPEREAYVVDDVSVAELPRLEMGKAQADPARVAEIKARMRKTNRTSKKRRRSKR